MRRQWLQRRLWSPHGPYASSRGRRRPIRAPRAHLCTRNRRKQGVRTNACKAIWAQSRAFRAAGGRLRTFRSRRSVPSEPPRCWPVRPSTRGVGDAKSGRIASMQNMLAARPTVGRIGTCSHPGLGRAMAIVAGARVRGWIERLSCDQIARSICGCAMLLRVVGVDDVRLDESRHGHERSIARLVFERLAVCEGSPDMKRHCCTPNDHSGSHKKQQQCPSTTGCGCIDSRRTAGHGARKASSGRRRGGGSA